MDLLYRAGLSKAFQFCSWIPEFTRNNFPQTISTWDTCEGPFQAGLPTLCDAKTTSQLVLAVQGFSVDVVKIAHPIRMGTPDVLSFANTMADYARLLKHCGTGYPTGESLDSLVLWLPIGNARKPYWESTLDHLNPRQDLARMTEGETWPTNFHDLISSINPAYNSSRDDLDLETQRVIANYQRTAVAFSKRMSGAVFCVTESGYAGLLPASVAVGDEICLLHGGAVPFVLRKRNCSYLLIGECYIHGIMYGEALATAEEEGTFYLK
jgi:hypothetical protein